MEWGSIFDDSSNRYKFSPFLVDFLYKDYILSSIFAKILIYF